MGEDNKTPAQHQPPPTPSATATAREHPGCALSLAQQIVYLSLTIVAVSLAVYLTVTGWWSTLEPAEVQMLAVFAGGMLGGLTHAIVEEDKGQRYELRFPAHRCPEMTPADGAKRWILDLGFVGQTFVGLMAAALVLGVLSETTSLKLLTEIDKSDDGSIAKAGLLKTFFWHFSVAFLSGFLGIRLIRQMANNLSARIDEATKAALVAKDRSAEAMGLAMASQAQALFNKARDALKDADYHEAEGLLAEMEKLEGPSVRSRSTLATIRRCQKNWPAAIAYLNDAIGLQDKEPIKSRVAAVYFNRACYRALMGGTPDVDGIIQDLRTAIQIHKPIAVQLKDEFDAPAVPSSRKGDLVGVKDDPRIAALVQELKDKQLM